MIEKININGVEYYVTPVAEGATPTGVTVKIDGVVYQLGDSVVATAAEPAATSVEGTIEKISVNGAVYDIADVEAVEAEAQRAQEAEKELQEKIDNIEGVESVETTPSATEVSLKVNDKSVTIPAATTEKAGVMSAEDKASLAEIVSVETETISAERVEGKLCYIKTGTIEVNVTWMYYRAVIDKRTLRSISMPSYWNSEGDFSGAAFFDKDMVYIGFLQKLNPNVESWEKTLELIPVEAIPDGARYVITTLTQTDAAELGIPEITSAKVASKIANLEKRIDDIDNSLNARVQQREIVYPQVLYNMVGKNNYIYLDQIVIGNRPYEFLLAATGNDKIYDNILRVKPATESTQYWSYLRLLNGTSIESQVNAKVVNVSSLEEKKSVKVLPIGDSITDLGYYQAHLLDYLSSDNVDCVYIGTQHRDIEGHSVSFEAKSGGNLSFIAINYNIAKIIKVNNVVTPPSTGYGSVEYTDSAGNQWRVGGHSLSLSNGLWEGKIRLIKHERDPNYGSGSSNDNTGYDLPTSGILTKSNGGVGDDTIAYTLLGTASENPLWNPATANIDWSYYFGTWGLEVPDVVLMQWGYNEVYNIDEGAIQVAVERARLVIDALHAKYPNVKVVFGFETFGTDATLYNGNNCTSSFVKKNSQLLLYRKWLSVFEGAAYNYVFPIPVYAKVDAVRGYGHLTEEVVNDVYGDKITMIANGYDGVHPPYQYGAKEIALAYEPVIVFLTKQLS